MSLPVWSCHPIRIPAWRSLWSTSTATTRPGGILQGLVGQFLCCDFRVILFFMRELKCSTPEKRRGERRVELPLLETDADKSAMERVRKPEPDLKPIGVWNTRDPRNQPEKANRLNQVDCFPRIYIYIYYFAIICFITLPLFFFHGYTRVGQSNIQHQSLRKYMLLSLRTNPSHKHMEPERIDPKTNV